MNIPQHLSDRYELGEVIGLGGMSEVHLARDVRLNRDVAIKVLRADLARDPGFYLRFRREAQNAAALNHPTIVAIYDTGETETAAGRLPFIVMEYVDGDTLRDLVDRDGPMDSTHAMEVIADACQALNFSHQQGIVHRDVKPANIMISAAGAVKVMDFGIARTLSDTTGGARLTQTAAVLGTAAYLSPEQASGEKVDARSDVYSLGCVLFELLTGEPPFVGETPVAVAYQHVRKDPALPSQLRDGISPSLDAVVLKALAKNPENRYQTPAEMRTDLIRVHSGESPEAPKVFTDAERSDLLSASSAGGRRHQTAHGGGTIRRWLITAVALVALAVVAIVGANALGNRSHPVRVPDVHDMRPQDAIAMLQNVGFKIRGPIQKADAAVPFGKVIDTDPRAGTALAGGDEVTLNVSAGPDQRRVPSCALLALEDCIRRLADAGFDHPKQTTISSPTVPPNMVVATVPAVGQLSVVSNDITIQVSTGPEERRVPDVAGQTVDQATASLKMAGFEIILQTSTDSRLPVGQVTSTDPPVGTVLSIKSAVTLKVSRGNQFPMPPLIGRTFDEAVDILRGLGYVGQLSNGGDVPGPETSRFKVVRQDPTPNTDVNRDAPITLFFGS